MNEYTCDQCHRTHNRSRKCLYCGAVSRYQKPTAAKITPKPSPAPSVMTESQRAGMVHERAALAYEASGQAEQAAAARQRAEAIQAAEVTA